MIPSYLYHYTSLDVLKLILSNKTIRFKRLDLLNDPLEGRIPKYEHLKKLVFTSSWTANRKDELPMWKMYTELKGVRFRMPTDLFCVNNSFEVQKRRNSFQIFTNLKKNYRIDFSSNLPIDENGNPMTIKRVYGPTMIEYVSDIGLLGNNVMFLNENEKDFELIEIEFDQVSNKKLDYWEFEKEYRFSLYPGVMIAGSDLVLKNSDDIIHVFSEFIDIDYDPKALQNIEILFGPKVEMSDIQEVEGILKSMQILNFNLIKSVIKVK